MKYTFLHVVAYVLSFCNIWIQLDSNIDGNILLVMVWNGAWKLMGFSVSLNDKVIKAVKDP